MADQAEYQSVVITLSDGTVAVFTGEAVAREGDERTVVSIKFTEPKPLPSGMYFDSVE